MIGEDVVVGALVLDRGAHRVVGQPDLGRDRLRTRAQEDVAPVLVKGTPDGLVPAVHEIGVSTPQVGGGAQQRPPIGPVPLPRVLLAAGVVDLLEAEEPPIHLAQTLLAHRADPTRGLISPGAENVEVEVDVIGHAPSPSRTAQVRTSASRLAVARPTNSSSRSASPESSQLSVACTENESAVSAAQPNRRRSGSTGSRRPRTNSTPRRRGVDEIGELRFAHRMAEHEPEAVGILAGSLQQRQRVAARPGAAGEAGPVGRGDRLHHVGNHGAVEVGLRLEVAVHDELGDPGRLGDRLHRRARVTAFGERPRCTPEDRLTPFGAGSLVEVVKR